MFRNRNPRALFFFFSFFLFILWSVNILCNERWNFLRCVFNLKWERGGVGGRCKAKSMSLFESFPSLPLPLQDILNDIWQYLTRTLNKQMEIETEILSFFSFLFFLSFGPWISCITNDGIFFDAFPIWIEKEGESEESENAFLSNLSHFFLFLSKYSWWYLAIFNAPSTNKWKQKYFFLFFFFYLIHEYAFAI